MALPPQYDVDPVSGIVVRAQPPNTWAFANYAVGAVVCIGGIVLLVVYLARTPADERSQFVFVYMVLLALMLVLYGVLACGLSTWFEAHNHGFELAIRPAQYAADPATGAVAEVAPATATITITRPACVSHIVHKRVAVAVRDVSAVMTHGTLLFFRTVAGVDQVVGRDPECCVSGVCNKRVGVDARALALVLQSFGNTTVNPDAIGEMGVDCCDTCLCCCG